MECKTKSSVKIRKLNCAPIFIGVSLRSTIDAMKTEWWTERSNRWW